MRILNYSEWLKLQPDINFKVFGDSINKVYEGYVKQMEEIKEHITNRKYPDCHCNHCIDAIEEYRGYNKYDMFNYRGHKIYIRSFCPLEHCKDIFVSELNTGFCDWLTIEEANKELEPLNKAIFQ